MTVIFDGKTFASAKQNFLREEVNKLKKKGILPKLVSILVGRDPASDLYLKLKKKAATEIGAEVEIVRYKDDIHISELVHEIKKFNNNKTVSGIMVQLPLPKNFSKKDRDKIINAISKSKDVDGLREDSPYITPTVKAVLLTIDEAIARVYPLRKRGINPNTIKVVVVGAKGFEGEKIHNVLKKNRYKVDGLDKETKDLKSKTLDADILISATGVPGLIKKDMVKEGVIIIDIGAPNGDIEKDAYAKAAFVSPVPGGVGPVTIFCLLENLVKAASL